MRSRHLVTAGGLLVVVTLSATAACNPAPLPEPSRAPATSVVPPELQPGGVQPTRPALTSPVAVSVSPAPTLAGVASPAASPVVAAGSPAALHPTLPKPSPAAGR